LKISTIEEVKPPADARQLGRALANAIITSFRDLSHSLLVTAVVAVVMSGIIAAAERERQERVGVPLAQ